VGADLRLAVAQHPGALGLQLVPRRDDVIHLIADVVDAAARIALQEALIGESSPRDGAARSWCWAAR
jgi:hypothetical protein